MPDGLAPLLDDGIIQRVIRPLMSGKEAQVYLVEARDTVCVAKVYKEAHARTFKNRAEYTEGRKTRNSRDQRAMQRGSRHGRAQDEAAWRSTEVDMIHRLHAAGVRVPVPYIFIDGVLVMECIGDGEGNPAPRLSDVAFAPDEARAIYSRIIQEIVRMLAVGVVHGDLSEFNVLLGADGPVIIDFPQSVDTASNGNARRLLLRDVENFHRFLSRNVPGAPRFPYAEEMWDLHELNALTAETRLTGRYRPPQRRFAGGDSVHDLIRDANRDEQRRRESLGLRGGPRELAQPQTSGGHGGDARRDGGRSAPPQRQGGRDASPPREGGRQAAPHPSSPREGAPNREPGRDGSHPRGPGQGGRGHGAPGQSRPEARGDQRRPERELRHDARPPRAHEADRARGPALPQRGAEHTADRPPSRGHGAPADPRRPRDPSAPPPRERDAPRERRHHGHERPGDPSAPPPRERDASRDRRQPEQERPRERAAQRPLEAPRSHPAPQPPRRPEGQRPPVEGPPGAEPPRQRPSRRQARTAPEVFIVRRPK